MNCKIDKIVKSRIPNNCVLILSNGENIFTPIDSVMKLGLNKGSLIDDGIITQIKKSTQLAKLKSYSMRISAGFIRSEKQIRDKLKQKGYEKVDIDSIIEWLLELKLIDDEKFCDNFIRYASSKKWGTKKISSELSKRGVDNHTISKSFSENFDESNQYENALSFAEKKIRLVAGKAIEKQKEAVFRHLISKGFEYSIIKQVVNKLFLLVR